jgi:hypothetical protein
MKTTETKKIKAPKVVEKNYVLIDGKKVSRTWAAMLANKNNPLFEIVDMQAVLK